MNQDRIKYFFSVLPLLCGLTANSFAVDVSGVNSNSEPYQKLRAIAEKVEKQGKLDSYARMRLALIERFQTYLKTEIQNKREKLAKWEVRDLKNLIREETERLTMIAEGKAQSIDSPKRVKTDLPRIVGTHLEQKVQWADGRAEDRPVLLFGFGHFQGMRQDIVWLGSQMGVNFCQSEMGPDQVMSGEGKWNEAGIADYRAFMKRADQAGVLVDLLISPHYMPEWAYKKHPDWRVNLGGFIRFPINQPGVKAFLKKCTEKTVSSFADEPNLWSCCLVNEPAFLFWGNDPDTRRLWIEYLKKNYKTLDVVNARWGTRYKTWNELPIIANHQDDRSYKTRPYAYDFMRFCDRRVTDWIAWLGACVKKTDPKIYTQAKQVDRFFTAFDALQSSDIDLMCRVTDLAGNDYSDPLTNTLLRYAGGKPNINSELHILGDGSDQIEAERNTVRYTFWLQVLTGTDAAAAWSWERDDSPNSPFVGLWPYRLGATEEYLRTGLDLMRVMPQIIAFRAQSPQVAVLYSKTSVLRNDPDAPKLLRQTFQKLFESGSLVGAVTEQMLANGELPSKLPDLKVLVLAGCTSLPDETVVGIKKFIRKGGSVVMMKSNEASYDPYCRRRPKLLSEEFPKSVTVLSDKISPDWTEILKTFKIIPDAFLVDVKTAKPAAGVVYRTVRIKDGLWMTAVNCSDKPIRTQWVDPRGRTLNFTDRLNLVPLVPASSFTMNPREVFLGTLQH